MNRRVQMIIGLGGLVALIIILVTLASPDSPKPSVTYPEFREIVKKRMISGMIVPRVKIEIKPHISGIIESLLVSIGDSVAKGSPIAKIRILPDLISLEQSEMRLRMARINGTKEDQTFLRNRDLFEDGIISKADFELITNSYLLSQEELKSALNQRDIILEGSTTQSGELSNIVLSTLSGVVLDLPLRAGSSIIKRNNFHEGTTIAIVADIRSLAFDGEVHEKDILYVKRGMKVPISVPAWNDLRLIGTISEVAPQGTLKNGTNKFKFRVALRPGLQTRLPSGISGIAEIVLNRASNVLALEEKNLLYLNDSSFVDLLAPGADRFHKQFVKTGLSDGMFVQILEGLSPESQVKVQD